MNHIEITDITGRTWIGDVSDEALDDDAREAIHDMLSDFKKLNYLATEIGGQKHYFNPAHIIAVVVVADGESA